MGCNIWVSDKRLAARLLVEVRSCIGISIEGPFSLAMQMSLAVDDRGRIREKG